MTIGHVVANFNATVAVELNSEPIGDSSSESGPESGPEPGSDSESKLVQAHPLRSLPLLVAGDLVECELEGDQWRVVALHPRSSVLERADRRGQMKALAANLTHLGIVSAAPPGIDHLLIDQFCIAAHRCGIEAMIIINKADRYSAEELAEYEQLIAVYAALGYPSVIIDTKTDNGMKPLIDMLQNKSVALVGASGVGKSSIIQQLLPDLDVRVGAISAATGFGSHTTSVTFRYALPDEAVIIDSPGVRQYSVAHLKSDDVRAGYRELSTIGANCRFANCTHKAEPDCAVKDLLEVNDASIARWRYDNYLKLSETS